MKSGGARVAKPKTPETIVHHYESFGEGVGVHVFMPRGTRTRPAIYWIHGGGFILGSAAQDYSRCIDAVLEFDAVVFAVEYRDAPEYPFPAPLDDVHTGWVWAVSQATRLRIEPNRIAIAGQSAGGGLAATLVQRVHDEGGVQPVAQWLFCPMLDDRTALNGNLDDRRNFLWDNRSNRVGWRSYLGVDPGAEKLPDYAAASRRNDLGGLPPTWIGVGDRGPNRTRYCPRSAPRI